MIPANQAFTHCTFHRCRTLRRCHGIKCEQIAYVIFASVTQGCSQRDSWCGSRLFCGKKPPETKRSIPTITITINAHLKPFAIFSYLQQICCHRSHCRSVAVNFLLYQNTWSKFCPVLYNQNYASFPPDL